MSDTSDLPSLDEVRDFVRNDTDDDDYQLWEIVSGVEQRFSVPTAEAVQLSYRAIESLLTDGLGELSFGHWDSEPRRVDATDLPPPEDEAQWDALPQTRIPLLRGASRLAGTIRRRAIADF